LLLNGVLFFNVFNDGGTKFLLLPVVNPFTEKESVVRVSLEVKPSLKRKQMGGGVSILVALPLLNHTISAGKSKWEGDRFKVSAGKSKWEGDIGSEGFTRSEGLTKKRKQMGGGVSILVALPLLNHTISAGKSKWEGDRFKVSVGRSEWEGENGSEGFTRSEALTKKKTNGKWC